MKHLVLLACLATVACGRGGYDLILRDTSGGNDDDQTPGDGDGDTSANLRPPSCGGSTLPTTAVDTTIIASTGAVHRPTTFAELQQAIDDALLGDLIELDPAATYDGVGLTLPNKSGSGWITITSLAAPTRATVRLSANGQLITTASGAHHFRFIALELTATPAVTSTTGFIAIGGTADTSTADLPHHIIFDRCFIHGASTLQSRYGVGLNGDHLAIIESSVTDWHNTTNNALAVVSWQTRGPILIRNNDLSGSYQNVALGSNDATIDGALPTDITVIGNHMGRPSSWWPEDPSYAGADYFIGNLMNVTNAQRVLIDANVFEDTWVDDNGGSALAIYPEGDASHPNATVHDITVRNNVFRRVTSGLTVRRNADSADFVFRILLENNLFFDLGARGGSGALLNVFDGAHDVAVCHNTALPTSDFIGTGAGVSSMSAWTIRDNITTGNLTTELISPVIADNVFVGGVQQSYPAGNAFAASLTDVGFTSDYTLSDESVYRRVDVQPGIYAPDLAAF